MEHDMNNDCLSFDNNNSIAYKISNIVTQMMRYWKDVHGWAPDDAAVLLNKSMLEQQASLAQSLCKWRKPLSIGDLILAWANFGAVVEGQLKLFLSVYYADYKSDANAIKHKERVIPPDEANFENIRIFFKKYIWHSGDNWDYWILMVQQRRNNIHAFKCRNDIGTEIEFFDNLNVLYEFIQCINNRLPYHDPEYKPQ